MNNMKIKTIRFVAFLDGNHYCVEIPADQKEYYKTFFLEAIKVPDKFYFIGDLYFRGQSLTGFYFYEPQETTQDKLLKIAMEQTQTLKDISSEGGEWKSES